MRKCKWSRAKLAEEAGVSRLTMRRWFNDGAVGAGAAHKVAHRLDIKPFPMLRVNARTTFGAISSSAERILRMHSTEIEKISAVVGDCALMIQRVASLRGVDCGVIVAPCKAKRAVVELYSQVGRFAIELEAHKRGIQYRLVRGDRSAEEVAGVGELTTRGAFFCVAFLLEAPRNQADSISKSFLEKNQLQALY